MLRPPFFAPHHDASKSSLVGGGTGRVRPGEISRAHCGVLFLDEFPLFRTDVIEALRQPLESGEVRVARGDESATFPARGMVVLACNPCPCGGYHAQVQQNRCKCSEVRRRDYQARVSGPISDRIDIVRHVAPLSPHDGDRFAIAESTARVRERVERARARQADRYAGCSWRLNAQAPGPLLGDAWPLEETAQRLLDDELYSGRLTSRGAVRVHRLSWTIADLRSLDRPGVCETAVALRLRRGDPLELSTITDRSP